jgi:hypothetical protein
MKLFRLLPLMLLGLVLIKNDTSACADRNHKKEDQKRKAEGQARSAHKALKAAPPAKVDLHPDFMIGNTLIRF